MEQRELTLAPESVGLRLDRWLAEQCPDLSRSQLQNLIEAGSVTCNGSPLNKKDKLKAGQTILLTLPDPQPIEAQPQNIPLDIVYEDDSLLVVNKPKGMVVHPAPGNPDGTMVNALLWHCAGRLSGIGGAIRPGIVHRIDKDTSGVLMVAKNDMAHQSLAAQLAEHSITRKYNAVVYNVFTEDEGTVDEPIGRNPQDRKKMAVTQKHSRHAVTHYRVIERMEKFTLIEAQLETGRTHQIRVHMTYIGHPLLGDMVYGPKKQPIHLEGQALHARVLGFIHPRTGEYLEFEAPLPPYFEALLERLRK